MRVIVTTVDKASVSIKGKIISSIGRGICMLVGFTDGDDKEVVSKMVDKILGLRIFPDDHGMINISLQDINGDIMSVSQFTLYADVSHGRRPSFINAMKPHDAELLYDYFNNQLEEKSGKQISTGIFGADMKVESINDGPFTLILDSKDILK